MKLPSKKSFVYYAVAVIAVLLFAFAIVDTAHGATVEARAGADWIKVTDAPCTNPKVLEHVLALTPAEMHPNFKAGTANIGGQDYAHCAILIPEAGAMGVIFEDGDTAMIPAEMFAKAE